jgi:hypothetical protein
VPKPHELIPAYIRDKNQAEVRAVASIMQTAVARRDIGASAHILCLQRRRRGSCRPPARLARRAVASTTLS